MGSLVRTYTVTSEGDRKPIRQNTASPKALMGHAKMANSKLAQFSEALATELGLDPAMSVKSAPPKTLSRAWEKAINKYDGDITAVTDFCRDRILFNDPEQIKHLRSIFGPGINSSSFCTDMKKRGIEVVEFEDYYMDPKGHGYIGLNMTLKVDLGKGRYHIVELQMMHQDMVDVDKKSHLIYEEMRGIIDTAVSEKREFTEAEAEQIGDLQEQNRALYREASEKLGLDSLQRPKYSPAQIVVPFRRDAA